MALGLKTIYMQLFSNNDSIFRKYLLVSVFTVIITSAIIVNSFSYFILADFQHAIDYGSYYPLEQMSKFGVIIK